MKSKWFSMLSLASLCAVGGVLSCTLTSCHKDHKLVIGEERTDTTYSNIKYKTASCEECGYKYDLVNVDFSVYQSLFLKTGQVVHPDIDLPELFKVTYVNSIEDGEYEAIISIKDKNKYKWYDESTDDVKFKYEITSNPKTLTFTLGVNPRTEGHQKGEKISIKMLSDYELTCCNGAVGYYAKNSNTYIKAKGQLVFYLKDNDILYPVYNDSTFSTEATMNVTATNDKVNISINGFSGADNYALVYRVKPYAYLNLDEDRGQSSIIDNGEDIICAYKLGTNTTLGLPRTEDKYDGIYYKYYVAGTTIIKGPVWTTEVPSMYKPEETYGAWNKTNKKGCFQLRDTSANCAFANVNLRIEGLIYNNEFCDRKNGGKDEENKAAKDGYSHKYTFNGVDYFFNDAKIAELDEQVEYYANEEKAQVSLIVLMYSQYYNSQPHPFPDYLVYPDAVDYAKRYEESKMLAYDTTTEKGAGYFGALFEFLAKRYSTGEHGFITSWTIGNEIDFAGAWYCSGDYDNRVITEEQYVEDYYRTMRLANLAISKYAPKEPCLIPFTKCWTKSGSGTKIKDFNVQRIFESICRKSQAQGNFYWGLNAHPYCDMKVADVFSGYADYRPVDLSTAPDYIDIINLEAYDIILSQDFTLYKGEMRPVYILEGGLGSASNNEVDQKKQAASMGYYLLEAHLCKAIKGFIYYRAYDAGESGKFGLMTSIEKGKEHKLSYDLFCEYEDDSFSFDEWNNKYLSYIKECGKNGAGVSAFTKDNYLTLLIKVKKVMGSTTDYLSLFKDRYGDCQVYRDALAKTL